MGRLQRRQPPYPNMPTAKVPPIQIGKDIAFPTSAVAIIKKEEGKSRSWGIKQGKRRK